jgi:hypothetical protein
MSESIIKRLRDHDACDVSDLEEAADILEFFFGQMQAYSPLMSGHCNYRFRSGWPMTHCVGNTPFEAVSNAVAEIRRENAIQKNVGFRD